MADAYHELKIKGPYLLIKGYLAGLLVGRGLSPDTVLFAHEHDIACEGLLEQVAEWLRLSSADWHVLAPASFYGEIRHALDQARPLGVELLADRPVRSATAGFSYSAYTERHASELENFVKKHAARLRLSDDYQLREKVDSAAEGVELYSPAHAHEVSAKGTVTGSLDAVLAFKREAKHFPLMTVESIHLHHDND